MLKKTLLATLIALLPVAAWAQTGQFTPGHAIRATTPQGVPFSDAGGAAGSTKSGSGYLTELGITNTGAPFCINDALTNAVGGYHRFCFGANVNGLGALIDYEAIGGATPLPITIRQNGADFPNIVGAATALSFPVNLYNGTNIWGIIANDSQNVFDLQGRGDALTTSIHVNPGPGALATGTITELSIQSTGAQAFGGNYGRWSFSNLGSDNAYQSGLIGEFGGTTPIGPFLLQVGIENPPSVFTSYEGFRFQANATAGEDAQQGAMLFGATATTPRNQIALDIASIGAPGARDSHAVLWEGKANDGTERAAWWREKVNVTANNGSSSFLLQRNLNGAGWTTALSVSDANTPITFGNTGNGTPALASNQLLLLNGSSGVPAYSFSGESTIGLFRNASGQLGLSGNLLALGTLNQFGSTTPAHIASGQSTPPALTSCGGGSPAISGSDTAGIVTMGTAATGCVITFNVAYNSPPACIVSWPAQALASQSYAIAPTAITLTQTSTSGNTIVYHCIGQGGG